MKHRTYNGTGILVMTNTTQGKKYLLLGKRRKGLDRGTWSIPGGTKEFCESPEETAKREFAEETTLWPGAPAMDKPLPEILRYDWPFFRWSTFLWEPVNPDLLEVTRGRDYEFSRIRWFPLNRLPLLTHPLLWPAVWKLRKAYR